MKLAKFLIRVDTSWESSGSIQDQGRPKIHKYGVTPNVSTTEGEIEELVNFTGGGNQAETPLILATKSGCIEIVREILETYPQAIEYIDDEGRNILHVAIKYRQLEIFELIKEMEVPMQRLVRKIDNNGNTILHMVGTKRTDYVPEKIEGPALELQEEMRWFRRVQNVTYKTVPYFLNHRNNRGLTAERLFATANRNLRALSKEWLKRTAEGCSLVSALIATVAFAAAYTVPGGSDENTGFPIRINDPFFVVFTLSDVLSLTFSLASVVTFLAILTSPFRFQDFRHSLPNKLFLGFTFLFLSVCLMMVAFAATVLMMIKEKENWTKILLYACSFIPVGIFAISYFPLYGKTYITRGCKNLREKAKPLVPQCFLDLVNRISCFRSSSEARRSSSYTIP